MPSLQLGVIGTFIVCHAQGEYARDEDGDGFHEVHVNTMEGFQTSPWHFSSKTTTLFGIL
nr:hypothetical protein [Chroococcidiopsis sp. CCMEE 29]